MYPTLRPAMHRRPCIAAALCAASWLAAATTLRAELRDGFESTEPAWRDVGGDARYRVERRMRIAQDAHGGAACEFWELSSTGDGTTIYLSYDVGQAPVIDELSAQLWVRSDRPGVRLLARVVFPRTLEPNTSRPVTALLVGTSSNKAGQWERLTLTDVRSLVEQQARVLRLQLRTPVDTGQAYIDRLLLNAYTGRGSSRLWIDDLEVTGVVTKGESAPAASPADGAAGPLAPISRTTPSTSVSSENLSPAVELKGQQLLVRGRPFFPRMLEHQGEPPALIRQLGFNAVRMHDTPSREFLEEAERHGLWIVCPPPYPPQLDDPYGAATAAESAAFGPEFSAVLAWDLGEGLTAADVERVKRLSEHVRRHDLPRARPTVCHAAADVRLLSRQVDIVTTYRMPLGTSFELADYGAWLRGRAGLARPGTPFWTTLQTQPSPQWTTQARLFAFATPGAPPTVDGEAMRLMLFEALAAGMRGVCFASSSSLAADDEATRIRAATMRMLNYELELIDIWSASGSFVSRVPGSEPDVAAALMQIDRGHLLLPLWGGEGGQFVPGQSAGLGISFVVPGVPESVDVYEITPGGLRPLERKRVAGGIRVLTAEFNLTTFILLTQDPQLTAVLARRLATIGPALAQAQREVAEAKLRQAEYVHQQLRGIAPPAAEADGRLAAAGRSLQAADRQFAAGNLREGYLEVRRALRPIALVERSHWRKAVENAGSPTVGPYTASFATLPDYWRTWPRVREVRDWANVLPCGEFESLDLFLSSGWKHYQFAQDGIAAEADLSRHTTGDPLLPTYCLRLAARPVDERATQGLLESAPLWITSPPISVRAGQLLRISGKVHVPEPITGSFDGLMIYDSIGGDVTAERFDKTPWKSFVYYRIAPTDGVVSLTAALSGFGEALIDDLKIEVAQ